VRLCIFAPERVRRQTPIPKFSPVRESLTSILSDEGYHVESAESAEKALERAAHGDLEVILLDVWLPGMDGLEALSRMQSIPPRPLSRCATKDTKSCA